MSLPIPSYTFVTSAGQRQFFHRWHFANSAIVECNKCGTICKETDSYCQHWQQQKLKLFEAGDELNAWQRTAIMKHQSDIVSQNIESFVLCDGRVVSDTQQFLLDAGITAIPDLLSVLYATDGCKELMVTLRFYVKIYDEMFLLQSSELEIKHHCDIRDSVDVIFLMLLQKLRTFMTCLPASRRRRRSGALPESLYVIKRIHIRIRIRKHLNTDLLQLPLQYRRKHAILKQTNMPLQLQKQFSRDLENLSLAFEKHLNSANTNHFKPPFPCNLYCFQTCANSLELYAVPYHINGSPELFLATRSFIILNNIFGDFLQLQEIGQIKRFLYHSAEDEILCCSQCQSNFMESTKMEIHKKLNCGYDFQILKIDWDFIEIYEECVEIMRCPKWLLYGIVK